MARKYLPADIIYMSEHVPYSDLNDYQRSLVKKYTNEKISPAMLSYHTGIDESQIMDRIDGYRGYGINPDSIRYVKDYGFVARTNRNPAGMTRMVRFYVVIGQSGQEGYFGDDAAIQKAQDQIRAGKLYVGSPPVQADALLIPQKKEEEQKKQFSNQDIIKMKGRGMSPRALTHEQRQLAYYMRQHPYGTLKGFHTSQKGRS